MLIKSANNLPDGYILIVKDGWRSYDLQLAIYNRMYESLKDRKPYLSDEELRDEISMFVSKGSLSYNNPSPHFTGGAVDISISNEKGLEANMGSAFDQVCPESAMRFYEEKLEKGTELTQVEYQILCNRRLLFHCMVDSGFTNYSNEWWHFDYGDQLWAKIKNRKAIYGLINPQL
jgi:D-alanyl-D-alanine dipeptidase